MSKKHPTISDFAIEIAKNGAVDGFYSEHGRVGL